ncbi:MAG: ABC-2 transporter permease [Oscillospiraceae bacterium]|nr:ABC-2 transporter permease [Oscillospiraceae bacterium]
MKNLLIKEIKLTSNPITFIFLAFTLMTFVPGYPILMGTFFISLGIFHTFRSGREANDTLYTVLLPIRKRDAVKARFIFVCAVQMAAMILMAIFTAIRMTVLKDVPVYVENVMLDANLVFLGAALLVFAAFNVFFVAPFFETAVKFTVPFVVFSVVAFIIIGAAEALNHVPRLGVLNGAGGAGAQIVVLVICIIVYIIATLLALKTAQKCFEKVDL